MLQLAVFMFGLTTAVLGSDVAVCPGEGDRYGDHKCNHDPTHRVCAQLLDGSGQALNWGKGDFWQITGQKAFQWDADIRANNGDSWCICMWATASLIEAAGCENVHLHCDATDVAYVMAQYTDGGTDLAPAKACLQQKCGAALQQKDSSMPTVEASLARYTSLGSFAAIASVVLGIAALGMVGLKVTKRRSQRQALEEGCIE